MPASKVQQVLAAQRRKRLIDMRLANKPFEEIAAELGYASRQAASKDFCRVLEKAIAEEATSAEVYREMELLRLEQELQRLDALYDDILTVMERDHITVSNGRVVSLRNEDGLEVPVPDDAPVLQAADRLLRIEDARRRNGERRAKLLGLDAPQTLEVSINDLDRAIADTERRLAAAESQAGQAAASEGAEG